VSRMLGTRGHEDCTARPRDRERLIFQETSGKGAVRRRSRGLVTGGKSLAALKPSREKKLVENVPDGIESGARNDSEESKTRLKSRSQKEGGEKPPQRRRKQRKTSGNSTQPRKATAPKTSTAERVTKKKGSEKSGGSHARGAAQAT